MQVLDAGYAELPDDSGLNRPVPITDGLTHAPVSQPWPLDGSGFALTAAQVASGEAVYRELDVYREKDFNELGPAIST